MSAEFYVVQSSMKIVRFALAILIAGARFAPATAAHNSAEPWQVMAIGDSITGSCYPAQLWRLLSEDHIGAFEFIGSRKARACGVEGFDGHTEWHPGYDPTALLSPPATGRTEPSKDGAYYDGRDLHSWFDEVKPDILLIHIGSARASPDPKIIARVVESYSTILNAARARNPDVVVFIAQLMPLKTGSVSGINAAIPAWAKANSRVNSPIIVVDMNSDVDFQTATVDGVHPNDVGTKILADRWNEAIVKFLRH